MTSMKHDDGGRVIDRVSAILNWSEPSACQYLIIQMSSEYTSVSYRWGSKVHFKRLVCDQVLMSGTASFLIVKQG